MKLEGRNLSSRMEGPDVGLLHNEFKILGYGLPSNETERAYFGEETRKAVLAFQKQHGLHETGIVDERTAEQINEAVEAKEFVVYGQILQPDGKTPARGVVVRAFDVDLRKQQSLGEKLIDNKKGVYRIEYTAAQFSRAEKKSADLQLRVFSAEGVELELDSDEIIFNAPQKEKIDGVLKEPEQLPELSEYEKLLTKLAPVLDRVPLAELDAKDIAFLAKETDIDRKQLELLVQSAQLSIETELSTQVFYGFASQALLLDLDSILNQPADVLRNALEVAIKRNIIPSSLLKSLDDILARIEQLRLDSGVMVTHKFFGRLHDDETSAALPHYTVQGVDLDAGGDVKDIGEDITNAKGMFVLAFVAPAAAGTTTGETKRRLQLRILDLSGAEIHEVTVEVTLGQEQVTKISIPVPEVPDDSASIKKLVSETGLQLSDEHLSHLESLGITTLEGLREKGGLSPIKGLQLEPETAARLQAHADLSILCDIELSEELIAKGLSSPAAIARASRAEFVKSIGPEAGDVRATRLHTEATATTAFLDNVVRGVYPGPRGSIGDLVPQPDGEPPDIFLPTCACSDCESAVSPPAYLVDLIDYAVTHLRKIADGGDNEPIDQDFLSEHFHQPFGKLPASCEAVEQEIRQIRISIEVLRSFLGARRLPVADKEAALISAEAAYVLEAYRLLLARIGTSYEELRKTRSSIDERENLSRRLGIAPERLSDLFIEEGQATETGLERLFGLIDTTRDPLSKGPAVGDSGGQITRWNLQNTEWNRNTDSEGWAYVTLKSTSGGLFGVELYRDVARTDLVASGERTTAKGSISLAPTEGSGLSGTVTIDYEADSEDIQFSVIPTFLCWQLKYLHDLWFDLDRAEGELASGDLIIDPDLIGPADLAHLGPNEFAYQRWEARRAEVDNLLSDIRSERKTDGLAAVILSTLDKSLVVDLRPLKQQLEEGIDIKQQLTDMGLVLPSFLRLLAIADLDEGDESVLDSEWEEVASILTQAKKQGSIEEEGLIETWKSEESAAGLSLSPDHFRIAAEEPEVLPLWRASNAARRDWQNRLRARIDQERTVVESLREAVDATEESTLQILRDALIVAASNAGEPFDAEAKRVARRLQMDTAVGPCQTTTRISQAIATIQRLIESAYTGSGRDLASPFMLDADGYSDEWAWLGSYATWRAAMFVFLYPENILLPSLRHRQTPAFRKLIRDLRTKNRLTPEQACHAAQKYAGYFHDVCSMQVDASCQARTRVHRGENCRERSVAEYANLVYFFGQGRETKKGYWSVYDPRDQSGFGQTYWDEVPGLVDIMDVIGAVPYRVAPGVSYICLFARRAAGGEQKLLLTRYNLEHQRWEDDDDEPMELELPKEGEESATPFQAVTGQVQTDRRPPHLAIRLSNGTIYDRVLNRDATGWRDENPENERESDGDWHVLVSGARGRTFQRLWAMVELDSGDFYLLVQDREDRIQYRLFGEKKDDGRWYPPVRRVGEYQDIVISDISTGDGAWKGEPIGAFSLPGSNELYVYWKIDDKQSVYQRVSSPPPAGSIEITEFGKPEGLIFGRYYEFDQWLQDVAGVSLKWIKLGPFNFLDFLTLDPQHFSSDKADRVEALNRSSTYTFSDPEQIRESEYKKSVQNNIDTLEGYIRDRVGFDWRYADSIIRHLTNTKDTLPGILRKLFSNRFGGTHVIVFPERKDAYSLRLGPVGLDRIAARSSGVPFGVPFSELVWIATHQTAGDVGAFRSYASLVEGEVQLKMPKRIAPRCCGPHEITERIRDTDKEHRRRLIALTFDENKGGPLSNSVYLEEAYYFVPMHLALQLQRRGQYASALEWFRTVYDYGLPELSRKIYYGLRQEETLSDVYERAQNWLTDPLNPHAIASIRANTYTRFTLLSIVRCLLAYADAEFTGDTSESVTRAQSLYTTALGLLDREWESDLQNQCDDVIESLQQEFGESLFIDQPHWKLVWRDILEGLQRIRDLNKLETVSEELRSTLTSTAPLKDRMLTAHRIVVEASLSLPRHRNIAHVITSNTRDRTQLHQTVLAIPAVSQSADDVVRASGQDLVRAISVVSGTDVEKLEDENTKIPWLRDPESVAYRDDGGAMGTLTLGGMSAGTVADTELAPYNPVAPSCEELAVDADSAAPFQAVRRLMKLGGHYFPSMTYSSFCVSPNPVMNSLRLHAELNLFKLRTCRNIAGDERQLEPYEAPTDIESGLPSIGAGGQIVVPVAIALHPTPYRYTALIERTKQLVGLAQQIEAAFLSALEKRDAEYYSRLRARQDVRLTHAGVRFQDLRVREAEDGVALSKIQKERSRIQLEHYDSLISEGLIDLEILSLGFMAHTAALHVTAANVLVPYS